jgi:hypothetical protein
MPVRRIAKRPATHRLAAMRRRPLDQSKLCAIATVSPGNRAREHGVLRVGPVIRNRAYQADLDSYRFYRLRPRRIKPFDEHALGGATFVTVAVGAGGRLRWVRTESYVLVRER